MIEDPLYQQFIALEKTSAEIVMVDANEIATLVNVSVSSKQPGFWSNLKSTALAAQREKEATVIEKDLQQKLVVTYPKVVVQSLGTGGVLLMLVYPQGLPVTPSGIGE